MPRDKYPANQKKMPVGVDRFDKIINNNYYYLDKTMFIKALLDAHGEVNLFNRPRRFGKTLNMSMLKAFFEIGTDISLFRGLQISSQREICRTFQGAYPVIFLSLKEIEGSDFAEAMRKMAILLSTECIRLAGILENSRVIDSADLYTFRTLKEKKANQTELQYAAATLMRMLHTHYCKPVILLIDEYDVPLDKANEKGYYDEMLEFLRGFLGICFKTNPDLYFAVVTGCLRISKESIFTGVNNLKTDTISDNRYDEYFGFTDADVRKILSDYKLSGAYREIKEWYDGYLFGDAEVYCPWDVINHCDRLLEKADARPKTYWNNTSSNALVKRFIDISDFTTRNEIEQLINGEIVYKTVIEDLTYGELEDNKDHFWSILYLTGYLTHVKDTGLESNEKMGLRIPNREIREIFIEKIQKWFSEKVENNRDITVQLYQAFEQGNASLLEEILSRQLRATISYYDSYESFYHGFLLGWLQGKSDWTIYSNRESGNGRSDIQIECNDGKHGIIIEVKHTKEKGQLPALCDKALEQIQEKDYQSSLVENGITELLEYGIAFHRKSCCVHMRKIKL